VIVFVFACLVVCVCMRCDSGTVIESCSVSTVPTVAVLMLPDQFVFLKFVFCFFMFILVFN